MNQPELHVDDVFCAVIELTSPAERAAYLDQACGNDPDMRRRVERLLEAHSQAGSFLGAGPAMVAATTDMPAESSGTVIGPYKLLHLIGEGGMGAVWMAEQTTPVQRKVALKIIKAGMDSKQVLARFEAERQALALMDHPNIAKVLDGGATAAGRPFFVMELVKGRPITRYCDEHRLTPRQRLELFVSVCQAIQHAHQKGIIHRDIKPSNVLVAPYDGKPVVKVIDFGVAKATGQRLTEKTLFTELGAVVGTLEYMSPEQAELNNQDIDTRSDIYALGVLLYELLTGSTPLTRAQLKQAAFSEMLRLIREEEPPKPSTRLSTTDELPSLAANRGLEPNKLNRLVRGELDWVVMKALEKDRNRRYETANGFAADVQRYLADEPVQACPPSAWYRVRKFARRHKNKVMVAAAMLTLVLAATTVSAWQAVRATLAEHQADSFLIAETAAKRQTREALDALADEAVETLFTKQPKLDEKENTFLRKMLGFYETFSQQSAESAEARFLRAKSLHTVAHLRGLLGEHDEAVARYRQAEPLLEQLAAEFPEQAVYRHKLARTQHNLGIELAYLGKRTEAATAFGQAMTLRTKLAGDYPADLGYLRELAVNYNDLGALRELQQDYAGAEESYRHCLDLMEKRIAQAGDQPRYHLELAQLRSNLGQVLRLQEKYAESEKIYREAVKVEEEQIAKRPTTAKDRQWLANGYNGLGIARAALQRMPDAEAAFQQALQVRRKLADDYPGVLEYRRDFANSTGDFAYFLAMQKKYAAAEENYGQMLRLRQAIVQDAGPVPRYRHDLARSYYLLAEVHRLTDRPKDAESEWRLALKLWEELAIELPKVPDYQHGLATTLTSLARLENQRGAFAAAVDLLEKARIHLQMGPARRNDRQVRESNRDYLLTLAHSRLGLGDHVRLAATAVELAGMGYDRAKDAYDAAGMLSRCATLVDKDKALAEAERQQRARSYGDRAMALVRQAVEAGFTNVTRMKHDANLAPLRERPEFRKLLIGLEQKK